MLGTLSQIALNVWLITTLFSIGFKINWKEFSIVKTKWKLMLTGVVLNLVVLPVILLGILEVFNLHELEYFGIYLFLVLAGSPISLKLADSSKQNMPFFIVFTILLIVLSTFLAGASFSIGHSFFHTQAEISTLEAMGLVMPKVIIPLILAITFSSFINRKIPANQKILKYISNISILAMVVFKIMQKEGLTILDPNFYLISLAIYLLVILANLVIIKNEKFKFGMIYGTIIGNTALCLIVSKQFPSVVYQSTLQTAILAIVLSILVMRRGNSR